MTLRMRLPRTGSQGVSRKRAARLHAMAWHAVRGESPAEDRVGQAEGGRRAEDGVTRSESKGHGSTRRRWVGEQRRAHCSMGSPGPARQHTRQVTTPCRAAMPWFDAIHAMRAVRPCLHSIRPAIQPYHGLIRLHPPQTDGASACHAIRLAASACHAIRPCHAAVPCHPPWRAAVPLRPRHATPRCHSTRLRLTPSRATVPLRRCSVLASALLSLPLLSCRLCLLPAEYAVEPAQVPGPGPLVKQRGRVVVRPVERRPPHEALPVPAPRPVTWHRCQYCTRAAPPWAQP
jgi:hypothetical protein